MTFCIQLCLKRAKQYHQETKYQEYSLYRDMPISPQRHVAMANRETETPPARDIQVTSTKKPLMT